MEKAEIMRLLVGLGSILGILVLSYRYKAAVKRVLSKKRQRQANRIVEGLKVRGHSAEICPECNGKGETRYFSWRLDGGQFCPKCDGMGFLYNLNAGEKEGKREEGGVN